MKLSRRGAKFIGSFEGFRSTPYRAVPSEQYLTIGYGHYGPDVKPGMRWSRRKAAKVLRKDAQSVADALRAAPRRTKFRQHEIDALISLGYNLGPGVFDLGRSVGDAIRSGSRRRIADAILLYDYAGGRKLPGLTRRREAERRVFLRGYRTS